MAEAPKDQFEESCNEFRKLNKTAFFVGYTGGAGKALLAELVETNLYEKLILLGRRKIDLPDDDKYANVEQRIVNFDKLEENVADFTGCHTGYCCLGVPAQQPNDIYVKVNRDYIVNTAKTAKSAGCTEFYLLSGMSVDPKSRFFHMRIKGEAEEGAKACEFEKLSIFRPGLIMIKREKKRTVEELYKIFTAPIRWVAPTKVGLTAEALAKAIVNDTVRKREEKTVTYENPAICKLGEGKDPFSK